MLSSVQLSSAQQPLHQPRLPELAKHSRHLAFRGRRLLALRSKDLLEAPQHWFERLLGQTHLALETERHAVAQFNLESKCVLCPQRHLALLA